MFATLQWTGSTKEYGVLQVVNTSESKRLALHHDMFFVLFFCSCMVGETNFKLHSFIPSIPSALAVWSKSLKLYKACMRAATGCNMSELLFNSLFLCWNLTK